MALYTVEYGGKKYKLEAPEGASPQDLETAIKGYSTPAAPAAPETPKDRTVLQELGRQVGLTGRNTLEAVGSVPAAIGNALEYAGVKGAGGNIGTTISDKMGLPTPETGTEKFGNELATTLIPGTVGYSAGAKLASKLPSAIRNGCFVHEPTVGGAAGASPPRPGEDPDGALSVRSGSAVRSLVMLVVGQSIRVAVPARTKGFRLLAE